MDQFKPKYKIGDRLRYKRHLLDTNSNISDEIFIILDVELEVKNNYFYYKLKTPSFLEIENDELVIDSMICEDKLESLQEIRKEKLNRINNIYQNES